jgi:hypothetical protein
VESTEEEPLTPTSANTSDVANNVIEDIDESEGENNLTGAGSNTGGITGSISHKVEQASGWGY